MNKTSAIVRLIIWSVVLVLLVGIFVSSFIGTPYFKVNILQNLIYSDDDTYNAGHYAEYGDKVDEIDIKWVDGSVDVQVYDGDTVIVEDTYNGDNDFYLMRSKVENGKLTVKYSASGINLMQISRDKNLTVKIPKNAVDFDEISIDAVSASISMKDVSSDRYKIDCVSGNVNVDIPKPAEGEYSDSEFICNNVSGRVYLAGWCKTVEISCISGRVDMNGVFDCVNVENFSGAVLMNVKESFPSEINLSMMSGNVLIEVEDGVDLSEGFKVDMDSMSGKLFTTTSDGTDRHHGEFTYGKGKSQIDVETMSGDVEIKY